MSKAARIKRLKRHNLRVKGPRPETAAVYQPPPAIARRQRAEERKALAAILNEDAP